MLIMLKIFQYTQTLSFSWCSGGLMDGEIQIYLQIRSNTFLKIFSKSKRMFSVN